MPFFIDMLPGKVSIVDLSILIPFNGDVIPVNPYRVFIVLIDYWQKFSISEAPGQIRCVYVDAKQLTN